jgi:hypothetical protein
MTGQPASGPDQDEPFDVIHLGVEAAAIVSPSADDQLIPQGADHVIPHPVLVSMV